VARNSRSVFDSVTAYWGTEQSLIVCETYSKCAGRQWVSEVMGECIYKIELMVGGYAVAQWVEALHYIPEGRGFDSQWSHWNFSVT
jgi:hypothetical protein